MCGKDPQQNLNKGAFLHWSKQRQKAEILGTVPKIVSRHLQPIEDSHGAARGSSVGARKPGGMMLSALGTRSCPGCQEGGDSNSVCSGMFPCLSWVDT